MFLDSQTSLIIGSVPLPNPRALQTEQPLNSTVNDNPLIDKSGENISYIGLIILVSLILLAVGLFSRKTEYVIAVALLFSLMLIGLLLVAPS